MKTKNLKVAYSSRHTQRGFSTVPKIQMEGKWLEDLGISIGSTLLVEYGDGSIRIRPLTEEESSARKRQELEDQLACKFTELEQLKHDLAMVAEPASYASSVSV